MNCWARAKNRSRWIACRLNEAAGYAAADAVVTYQLVEDINARTSPIPKRPKRANSMTNLEIPLIPVLANMEMAGVLIDRDFLAANSPGK